MQWMQYAVDTVHSEWTQYTIDTVCSGIVVYGGGDIGFDTKRSNQWMQYAVHSSQWMPWNSGIWWRVHCPLCHCIHCILWFDIFAPKTMSPPPYTTFPLHTVSTVSTVYCVHCIHWFDLFAPKTMSPPPYHTSYHYSTAYCVCRVLCRLCPLV